MEVSSSISTKKIVFISGAYRGATISDVSDNIATARKYAVKYWKMGYTVICPHLNSAFMDGIVPDSSFLDGDLEMLRRCDCIVMIPNYHLSSGAVKELDFARSHNIEIIHDKEVL